MKILPHITGDARPALPQDNGHAPKVGLRGTLTFLPAVQEIDPDGTLQADLNNKETYAQRAAVRVQDWLDNEETRILQRVRKQLNQLSADPEQGLKAQLAVLAIAAELQLCTPVALVVWLLEDNLHRFQAPKSIQYSPTGSTESKIVADASQYKAARRNMMAGALPMTEAKNPFAPETLTRQELKRDRALARKILKQVLAFMATNPAWQIELANAPPQLMQQQLNTLFEEQVAVQLPQHEIRDVNGDGTVTLDEDTAYTLFADAPASALLRTLGQAESADLLSKQQVSAFDSVLPRMTQDDGAQPAGLDGVIMPDHLRILFEQLNLLDDTFPVDFFQDVLKDVQQDFDLQA